MNLLEKSYTFLILAAIIIGLSLGRVSGIPIYAEAVITPLLMLMLYLTFLNIPISDMKKAFQNIRFTYTSIIINFAWTPLLAWVLALIFLSDHPALMIGFIMLMVTPCTDWYLIFTGIAKGNVALSTAILPLNLLLQVILLPLYLFIFARASGAIEPSLLLESIVLVLILPLALAFATNLVLGRKPALKTKLLQTLSVFPMLLLSLAIVALFAAQGSLLFEHLDLLWLLILPILCFFVINCVISQRVGKWIGFLAPDRVSLSLTTLARNSPIALAIAMTAFPNEPLIALALVIGPLLELPILAIVTQILMVRRH
ncbi:arsenic resistance protein [Alkalihalobacillus hemicellulosilyticus]|uniref:Arsenical-resistance protein ACR3 n=1 Tax=Halalkalibacter hemicellulosilyticusJCM 9152 TaxID=1236971 RepID=W4QHK4_9BACI|nr:bile acid:sodium symporter [Halalkalibacter hemicellulosilyticus]GAE31387.1 arsenical-resistance protein ACR3 [Halalkalibacter hemicellulosilyticusJCM 9152]